MAEAEQTAAQAPQPLQFALSVNKHIILLNPFRQGQEMPSHISFF
jgi:hypothetical protein